MLREVEDAVGQLVGDCQTADLVARGTLTEGQLLSFGQEAEMLGHFDVAKKYYLVCFSIPSCLVF